MQTTFVLRLMTANREILAWTKIHGESRGDGALWPCQDFVAEGEADGQAAILNVHWPEVGVNVNTRLPEPFPVRCGQIVSIRLSEPLMRIGTDTEPLPGVTVRSSVTVGVPQASR